MTTDLITTETVRIGKLVYKGDGLGRLPSGEVVFVPWSAPEDELSVDVLPDTKPRRGEIRQIQTPSPDRVIAKCSVFGICGGCQWQHITPEAQRRWKREIVAESLSRIGKLPDVAVQDVMPAGDWHYRNNAQWVIGEENGRLVPGYFMAASHEMTPFDHCWIIPDELNAIADALEESLPVNAGINAVQPRINEEGEMLLVLSGENPDQEALSTWAEELMDAHDPLRGIVLETGRGRVVLAGDDHLVYTLSGLEFRVSAGSFFQTNTAGAELMLGVLNGWLGEGTDSLVDLYAGVGTFAVALHRKAKTLLGVESESEAILDFQENLKRNRITNVQVRSGDVRQVLNHLKQRFETAIVDPPRAGCAKEVLNWLTERVSRQLIYISCDPTTLARDLAKLTADGWKIQTVQPVDLFPQTYHIETLVLLSR